MSRRHNEQPAKGYKISEYTTPTGQIVYSLRLHPSLAQLVPPGARFQIELTSEGILYRIIETPKVEPPPEWTVEA